MSVGAGSIKRAAKAANVAEEEKEVQGKPAEKKASAEKKTSAKKTAAQSAEPKAQSAEPKAQSSEPKAQNAEPETAGRYEAYGVGQELPMHLM